MYQPELAPVGSHKVISHAGKLRIAGQQRREQCPPLPRAQWVTGQPGRLLDHQELRILKMHVYRNLVIFDDGRLNQLRTCHSIPDLHACSFGRWPTVDPYPTGADLPQDCRSTDLRMLNDEESVQPRPMVRLRYSQHSLFVSRQFRVHNGSPCV